MCATIAVRGDCQSNRFNRKNMQTILGANGQIATELALELCRNYTTNIRLVSRNPQRVNDSDSLYPADLLDKQQTEDAVKGSDIVYFTPGMPPDTQMWQQRFPLMLENALAACIKYQAKFVYFDNTYMYPQDARVLTEHSIFAPVGPKGEVRAAMAKRVLDEMMRQQIPVVICRAPEFYGAGKTQSITNTLIIDALKQHKTAKVPLRADTLRTLIWTPDASKAMALIGNTPDAFGTSWHLPCDDQRLTYQQFIQVASKELATACNYRILNKFTFTMLGLVVKNVREIKELLPRYQQDNLFDSSAFKRRFPTFNITTYAEGLRRIGEEHALKNQKF
jgi:nucleoside-diphosphate-sugar epimerase